MRMQDLRQSAKEFGDDVRGAIALVVGLAMVVIIGFAALAIDGGYVYLTRTQLQAAADSAAMAAVAAVPKNTDLLTAQEQDNIVVEARSYAQKNMPVSKYGNVLASVDVVPGHWDPETRIFYTSNNLPQDASFDAVKVTTRRDAQNGNPVGLLFASVIGFSEMDLGAVAIGYQGGSGCRSDSSVFAQGEVTMGQDIRVRKGTCIYGRLGVHSGQDPIVEEGSYIGALDENTITFGQSPQVPEDAIVEADLTADLALNIADIIDNLQAGIDLPPNIDQVVTVNRLPSNLQPRTAYIVNGNVSIGQDYSIGDVIIAARGNISWGQDGAIRNTGSCDSGAAAIGIFATGRISLGQDAILEHAQVIAGDTSRNSVRIGQDVRSLVATIQSAGDISIGQDPHFTGCGSALFESSGSFGPGGGLALVK